jgi:hypothetical protein
MLRQGRKVPQHVYLQLGDEPSDDDLPLFTVPSPELAAIVVKATNAAVTSSSSMRTAFHHAGDDLVRLG